MEEKTALKPKLLFVFDMPLEKYVHWCDGLWAALELLLNDFTIAKYNLSYSEFHSINPLDFDFILGWGGFNSPVDNFLHHPSLKMSKGLCLGGYGFPPKDIENYKVIFYETSWSRQWINANSDSPNIPRLVHAFGINSKIFNNTNRSSDPLWDYITVGAFSNWKRQIKILDKPYNRLAIGEIQKGNMSESMEIVEQLVRGGVMVSDEVHPAILSKLLRNSKIAYIPATEFGGGERSILEARACGCKVEAELDNTKLQELLTGSIGDENYYAEQLKEGILSCLK